MRPEKKSNDPAPLSSSVRTVVTRLRARTDEEEAAFVKREADREARARESDRRNRLAEVASGAGARYSPARVSLESFRIRHPAQQIAVNDLKAVNLGELIGDGRGLIFYGPVGTGKDHLAIAMLYRAANEGISGKWINGQEWFGQIRDRISEERSEQRMIDDLAKPKILVISDPIPARRDPSPFNVEMLFRLVDRRYRDMSSTWLTMNVAAPEEADEKLSSPVFDRLGERAVFVKCFWPSWRERKFQ